MGEIAINVQNVCVNYKSIQHMSIHQSLVNRKNEKKEKRSAEL